MKMKDNSKLKGLLTELQIKYRFENPVEGAPVCETFTYTDDEIWGAVDLYFWIEKDEQHHQYYVYRVDTFGPQIKFPRDKWGPRVSLVIQEAVEQFWHSIRVNKDTKTI